MGVWDFFCYYMVRSECLMGFSRIEIERGDEIGIGWVLKIERWDF